MHDLELGINLAGWRIFVRRKHDKKFQPVMKRVFERDAYTCQYCGFQAKEFQEVVNLDGNYSNSQLGNLITACCFCAQCLFLQVVGLDELGGGQLIYLPEIKQNDLNSFCHVLFCAMGNQTGYQDSAQSIYRSFKFRSQLIENRFGSGSSNPAVMGQIMIEHIAQYPKKRSQVLNLLKGMRLLPSNTKFKVQLDTWAQSALQELEAEESVARKS